MFLPHVVSVILFVVVVATFAFGVLISDLNINPLPDFNKTDCVLQTNLNWTVERIKTKIRPSQQDLNQARRPYTRTGT